MQKIFDFIIEIDKLKGVIRKSRLITIDRHENSAEHSWQIALLAMSLIPYATVSLDVSRVVSMLLVHDIGEIDTGDTMFYVEGGWEVRKAAEHAAVKRIFAILPQPQGQLFLELWEEFERAETHESRFANAADRAMPALLNLENGGYSWKENGINYEQVVTKLGPPIKAGCPALWDYMATRLEAGRSTGMFAAN